MEQTQTTSKEKLSIIKNPCINCIVFPICKAHIFNSYRPYIVVELSKRCSLMNNYLLCDDPESDRLWDYDRADGVYNYYLERLPND